MARRRSTGPRLVQVISHPIQYFIHRYRHIAARDDVDFQVLFGSRRGLDTYHDAGFGVAVAWDTPLLGGYESSFPGGDREATAAEIWRALDHADADGVWINGYANRWTRAAWAWGLARRRKVFLFADSNVHVDLAAPSWKRLAKRAALTPLFRTLSAALVSSDANEAWYRLYGMPGERLIRFPFTVDDDVFGAAWRDRVFVRSRFREAHGIPPAARVALWCGKLTPAKRPLDLVAAVIGDHRDGPAPPWPLFAGDGPLRPEVEARLRAAGIGFTVTGFLNSGDVPAAFAAADFLVHTRGREPHGLVAVEAARMGLPMVVPDTMGAAGPRSAARPGVNAVTFSAGSIGDLSRAMRLLSGADAARFDAMATASSAAYADLWGLFESGVAAMIARLLGD